MLKKIKLLLIMTSTVITTSRASTDKDLKSSLEKKVNHLEQQTKKFRENPQDVIKSIKKTVINFIKEY